MAGAEIERLIQALAKLPGLGPRSARRAALVMLNKREALLHPLATALNDADRTVRACSTCGNLDSSDPCKLCADARRDGALLCVVEDELDEEELEGVVQAFFAQVRSVVLHLRILPFIHETPQSFHVDLWPALIPLEVGRVDVGNPGPLVGTFR